MKKLMEAYASTLNTFARFAKGIHWRFDNRHAYYGFVKALLHRQARRNVVFVGITGSAGKTTAKECAAAVLSSIGPCYKTPGSINRANNVSKAVLETDRSHHFAVFELSESAPGALYWPVRFVRPHIAVLTVVGREHYRKFGKLEGIASELAQLVHVLPSDGTAVLNIDDPLLRSVGQSCKCRVIWVGKEEGADLRLMEVRSDWPEPLTLRITYLGRTWLVPTRLHGTHLALSVLCGLAVGIAARIPIDRAIDSLLCVTPEEGRMQVISADDGVTFVRDDWKAPEWSLHAPLEFLRDADAPRKVAVVGTVSDSSGDNSAKYRQFARRVLEYADLVVFVGRNAHRALRARNDENRSSLHGFLNIRDASNFLRKELRPGDLVLLKGSNKSDHLVRLYLDRYEAISCWVDRCGKNIFCGQCPRLRAPREVHADGEKPLSKYAADVLSADWKGTQFELNRESCAALIVGLGNPGSQYRRTPHNIGEEALDVLADRLRVSWTETAEGQLAEVRLNGGTGLMLFKPGTMMNRSGPPVRRVLDSLRMQAHQCIVMHDDMDLLLGTVRKKETGGDAGHNGLRSLIEALGTDQFRRIRIGIRSAGDTARARQRVLERFPVDLEQEIAGALDAAASIAQDLVATDPTTRNGPHTGKTGAVDEQG